MGVWTPDVCFKRLEYKRGNHSSTVPIGSLYGLIRSPQDDLSMEQQDQLHLFVVLYTPVLVNVLLPVFVFHSD